MIRRRFWFVRSERFYFSLHIAPTESWQIEIRWSWRWRQWCPVQRWRIPNYANCWSLGFGPLVIDIDHFD